MFTFLSSSGGAELPATRPAADALTFSRTPLKVRSLKAFEEVWVPSPGLIVSRNPAWVSACPLNHCGQRS